MAAAWPDKGKATKGSNVSVTPLGKQSAMVQAKGKINLRRMLDEEEDGHQL